MRPSRLGEVFDDAGNVVIALDQQHVAGSQRLAQRLGIARRKRLVAGNGLVQVAGDHAPNSIEHPAHGGLPAASRGFAASLFVGTLCHVRCNLVHVSAALLTEIKPYVCAFRPVRAICGETASNWKPCRANLPQLSRRSFLAASAALAARSGARRDGADFGSAGGRHRRRRRRRRRRRAPHRRRRPPLSCYSKPPIISAAAASPIYTSFGVPFDRGAHWIYLPDFNPLTKLTPRRGIDVYPAPPSQKVRIGRRYAREGELEDFLSRPGADHARHRRRRAQGRCSLRAGAAERSRRLARERSNSCSARTIAPRIWRRFRRSTSRAPPSAMPRRFASRVLARCSPCWRRASTCSCRRRRRPSIPGAISRWKPQRARSPPAPRS